MNTFKKGITAILALTLTIAFTSTPLYAAQSQDLKFKDISESDWYYDSVKYAYDNGIVDGVAKDKFAPNLPVSRAMAVTMLYRANGAPKVARTAIKFEDVIGDSWYGNAVMWAAQGKLVLGDSPTTFTPDRDMTRAEFATILARYAAENYLSLPDTQIEPKEFADVSSIPYYALQGAHFLSDAKVIEGRTENTFEPNATITRAEAVTMLERFLETAVDLQQTMSEQYGFEFGKCSFYFNRMPTVLEPGSSHPVKYGGFSILLNAPSNASLPTITGHFEAYTPNAIHSLVLSIDNNSSHPEQIYGIIPDVFTLKNGDTVELYTTLTIAEQTYLLMLRPTVITVS